MGLKGKMTLEKEIKCHGDVFHDLYRHKPHHIANVSPNLVHSCDVDKGGFGKVGSILNWEYTLEGKKKSNKAAIEAIDEEKKLVKFKAVGGEILELYKEFQASIHVDKNGDDHTVTWTIEYEKVSEDVPDPISYMELISNVTKDIEAHHTT